MLTIFYRRFYILLFLIWLSATAGLFVLSVWGNFDTLINGFSRIEQEVVTTSTAMNRTGPTDMLVGDGNGNDENVVLRASDAIVHKARVAGNAIRRDVIHEVQEVEDVFIEKKPVPDPIDPIAAEIAANKTRSNSLKERDHAGFGKLTEISFNETSDKFLAQLKTSKSVQRATFFWLEKPTRLVVDLRGEWKSEVPTLHRFSESFISLVAIGMHPDRLRLVFKFTDQNAPKGKRPELVWTDEGLNVVVGLTGNTADAVTSSIK